MSTTGNTELKASLLLFSFAVHRSQRRAFQVLSDYFTAEHSPPQELSLSAHLSMADCPWTSGSP